MNARAGMNPSWLAPSLLFRIADALVSSTSCRLYCQIALNIPPASNSPFEVSSVAQIEPLDLWALSPHAS